MDLNSLIKTIHSKGEQEELLRILNWWYETSDSTISRAVLLKLEQLAYKITLPEAEQIVHTMQPQGQHWTARQVKDYIESKGDDAAAYINYYLVMNMAYNDYYGTAKLFGLQNDPEFFYSIARDFINDQDAKPFKIEKYFESE